MRPQAVALLVTPAGHQRRALAAALQELGLSVRTAAEPYAAAAALGEATVDLVVLDLGVTRLRDRAFVRALARRAPGARLLLLLPEGRRALAKAALAAGADAYVLAPPDPEEVQAVARALLGLDAAGADPRALIRLSDEVAHAVNNPLQVLSLWAEGGGRGGAGADPTVRETIARVRDVVGLLTAFGRLAQPQRAPLDVGQALEAALERAAKARRIQRSGKPVATGVEAAVDAAQIALALDTLLACLGGLVPKGAVPVRARVRPARDAAGWVRLQVRAAGIALAEGEAEALPTQVLRSHSDTRQPHPGLALPAAVAALHGGALRLATPAGALLVTLRLPA